MIELVRAEQADSKVLTDIQKDTFLDDRRRFAPDNDGGPFGFDSVDYQKKMIEQADYYKILLQNKIIGGVILLLSLDGASCTIVRMFIHPSSHNKGFGKMTLKILEEMHPNVKIWMLDTPEWAERNHRFYESIGYRKVMEEYSPDDDFTLWYFEKVIE